MVLLESGGDNLSATFLGISGRFYLCYRCCWVTDRESRPAIRYSDLLIINKTDLAPLVGADLEVMDRDAKMREDRPFIFTDLKTHKGLDDGCLLTKDICFRSANLPYEAFGIKWWRSTRLPDEHRRSALLGQSHFSPPVHLSKPITTSIQEHCLSIFVPDCRITIAIV